MGQIKVLEQNMINMIAAGEVIERPASVVKELMENSVDAGASEITVRIEDGGKKLISVTDNGCGMDANDLELAFCPHATSKITTSAELLNISTMGFRGEALASIGAVARVRIVSKTTKSVGANVIEIDCGDENDIRPCHGNTGTAIEVRDIFYKMPARQKFLRTANTEASHLSEQFTRIALANTSIAMTLFHNGREVFTLGAGQGIKDRIAALFTPDMPKGLFEVRSSEQGLKILGYLSKPENARANSKYQYIFLNGRFIRNKLISHALKEAYRSMIEADKFPAAFLFLKMPPRNFDVNVHPTKVEVRFDNPNFVHSLIHSIVREKILSLEVYGRIPVDTGSSETNQTQSGASEAVADFFRHYRKNGQAQGKFDFSTVKKYSDEKAGQNRENFYTHPEHTQIPQKDFIQIHNSYILAVTDDGFMIIDQHALHERIIYRQLCGRLAGSDSRLQSQKLLLPETFQAAPPQIQALQTNTDLFERLGIEASVFGPGTVAVNAFPTLLKKANPADFVRDMLDLLAVSEVPENVETERLLHKILDMAACKAAVKAGQKLSDSEISRLLADKETFETNARCPHGRPTTIRMSMEQLAKQFGRT